MQPLIKFLGRKNSHECVELIVAVITGFVSTSKKMSSLKKNQPPVLAALSVTATQNYVDAG